MNNSQIKIHVINYFLLSELNSASVLQ